MHNSLFTVEDEESEALVSVEWEPNFDGGMMSLRANVELVAVVEKEDI